MVTAIGGHRRVRSRQRARRRPPRAARARPRAGSAASDSAEITATPSAPAAITSAGVVGVDAGDGADRKARRSRARIASAIARRPSRPIGARGLSFDVVRVDAADRRRSRADRAARPRACATRLDRQPDDGAAAEQPRASAGRHVVLADMHAVGAGGQRDVDAVVDEQRHAARRQRRLERARLLDHGAGRRRACRAAGPTWRRRRPAGGRDRRSVRPPARAGSTMRVETEIDVHHDTFTR